MFRVFRSGTRAAPARARISALAFLALALALLGGCGSDEGPAGVVTDLEVGVPAWTGSVAMEIGR